MWIEGQREEIVVIIYISIYILYTYEKSTFGIEISDKTQTTDLSDNGERNAIVLKSIETTWKGFRFRSRLEARWAVFFDRAGVEFEYEPEGFQTAAGKYLPDFYLPELEEYLEIKPRLNLVSEYDWRRIAAFATEKSIHVLAGQPWPTQYRFACSPEAAPAMTWITCQTCGKVVFSELSRLPGEVRYWCQICELANPTKDGFGYARNLGILEPGAMNLAFIAARSARFEHGEKP